MHAADLLPANNGTVKPSHTPAPSPQVAVSYDADLSGPGTPVVQDEVHWSPPVVAESAAYDFVGYLEFCLFGNTSPPQGTPQLFGYRTSPTGTCTRPGPVIRMQPGMRYKLVLHNGVSNRLTNLHTHGLHISGSGNADDITREVNGGDCLVYNYTIPVDHRGGTFWYHAHRHMSIEPQVRVGGNGFPTLAPSQSPSRSP